MLAKLGYILLQHGAWGLQFELISHPTKSDSKDLEKRVKKNVTTKKGIKMKETEIESLPKKYLDIWTEKDATKRILSMKEVYLEDVEIVDTFFATNG